MRSRQSIAELFSTFLQFDADRFRSWVADARLRRSIQACLEQSVSPEMSENFWALYWHKLWLTQPYGLAEGHLAAYVQEPCYWAAVKISDNFASTQYKLSDCFQMAIAQLEKVLRGFDSQQGFNFKNYAIATFGSLIRESLRQRQEIDICTDWALLRKISQKRLIESLQSAGLAKEVIDSYVLAWNCFRTIYTPVQSTGTRKLPKPETETWEAIVHLYQSERSMLVKAATPTPESLEKWLTACAKAVRSYLYPTAISLNAPKPGEDATEPLDKLGFEQTSLLNEMIATEEAETRQSQYAELNTILTNALNQLDADSRTILDLYYRQELTQQQMAVQLNTKQYTVSRRLTRARESLLKVLAIWTKETLHISPTTDVLKNTSSALEEWLVSHYKTPTDDENRTLDRGL